MLIEYCKVLYWWNVWGFLGGTGNCISHHVMLELLLYWPTITFSFYILDHGLVCTDLFSTETCAWQKNFTSRYKVTGKLGHVFRKLFNFECTGLLLTNHRWDIKLVSGLYPFNLLFGFLGRRHTLLSLTLGSSALHNKMSMCRQKLQGILVSFIWQKLEDHTVIDSDCNFLKLYHDLQNQLSWVSLKARSLESLANRSLKFGNFC